MDIENNYEEPVVFSPDETVSKTISKMCMRRKHEALVMKGKRVLGMLTARDFAKRKIGSPQNTRITKFMRDIKPLPPGYDVNDVMNYILVNDYKSVPVKTREGGVFFVTKLGLLKELRNSAPFKDKKAYDIMVSPYCVDSSDSISTAMSVIRELNISRIPVVDGKNRTMGLIDSIDLLKAEIEKSRSAVGDKSGESIKPREGVLASSLMQKNIAKASPDTPLPKVIGMMLEKNTETVLIERGGRLAGIITPKMILKLIGKRVGGVYVRISGIRDEDDFIKTVIDEQIRNEIRKLGKLVPIEFMVLNVDRHHKTGRRVKYSVKSTLATQKGTFHANDFAWDITKCIRGVLQKLEKETIKRKEKEEKTSVGRVGKPKSL